MIVSMASSVALTVLVGLSASAAEPGCNQYIAAKRLPDTFTEIASGLLRNTEFFVLTNGTCTCDNGPAIARQFGRPAAIDANWSCRTATDDERRTN
ncbi:MAG: hypothetical protein JWN71_1653 [Xanthobacteraceae bacterium]|jgi:hypothetical protein|nr:hypothetical protein [Xanthobacteraceae bacterium]